MSAERQGAGGLCFGPSTGPLWALKAVGLLIALGCLGGLGPRGTYLYRCTHSKGWWCGLCWGFPEAALLRLVFCPCLPGALNLARGCETTPLPALARRCSPRD